MTWRNLDDVLHELTDAEIVELDRYRPRPPLSTYKIRRHTEDHMRQRFVEGTKDTRETLTPEEKANYRKGRW